MCSFHSNQEIYKKNRNRQNPSEKYTLESKQLLGEGAFGSVYLITRRADGIKLIMKQPKMSSGIDMEDVKIEADLLARLKHPNIIKYTEAFWNSGSLIIITEFASAGDLFNQIEQTGGEGLYEEDVVNWFLEMCDGVKYMHDRHILHRDLKPENIFISEYGTIKIGDLGLARELNPREYAVTNCGTLPYMAPELHRGIPYDEMCDIWALGCILFEMATGKCAFRFADDTLHFRYARGCPRYCIHTVEDIFQEADRRPTADDLLDAFQYED